MAGDHFSPVRRITTNEMDRIGWADILARSLGAMLAVVVFLSPPVCLLIWLMVGLTVDLIAQTSIAGLALIFGPVAWYYGAMGSALIGFPVTVGLVRLGVANWPCYAAAGAISVLALMVVDLPSGFSRFLHGPENWFAMTFVGFGAIYGAMFWFAQRWVQTTVLSSSTTSRGIIDSD